MSTLQNPYGDHVCEMFVHPSAC